MELRTYCFNVHINLILNYTFEYVCDEHSFKSAYHPNVYVVYKNTHIFYIIPKIVNRFIVDKIKI